LCQYSKELDRLNVTVLLISFGPREKAGDWLEEMCPSFQLLIDTDYNVYGDYKLRHSWSGSWNLKTLFYYTRALAGGRKWRGIIGDSTQMGGDFIIDRDGSFRLEYRSKVTTDRPSVPEIMDMLRE